MKKGFLSKVNLKIKEVKKMKKVMLLIVLVVLALSSQANALLMGETIEVTYLFPDTGTIWYGPGNVVVGAGPELQFNIGGTDIIVDIEDSAAIFSLTASSIFNPGSFNGVRLTDVLNSIPDFTSVLLDASTTLNNVAVSFDANNIYVDFVNSGSFSQGDFAKVNIAAVPEPSTLLLFGAGLVGLVFARKRMKK